ncbi:hypothetical protein [Pseudomonas viridiflava]|uniref:hypothetical protein n=1 Tax=Pseudomonas viridiflava TaxID=33069 RepID=UPI000F0186AE|nr:hypothetical protein [Pseudomonas viridiflava]
MAMANKPLNKMPLLVALLVLIFFVLELVFVGEIFGLIGNNAQALYEQSPSSAVGGMAMVFTWLVSMMAIGLVNVMVLAAFGMALLLAVPEMVEEKETDAS